MSLGRITHKFINALQFQLDKKVHILQLKHFQIHLNKNFNRLKKIKQKIYLVHKPHPLHILHRLKLHQHQYKQNMSLYLLHYKHMFNMMDHSHIYQLLYFQQIQLDNLKSNDHLRRIKRHHRKKYIKFLVDLYIHYMLGDIPYKTKYLHHNILYKFFKLYMIQFLHL